ncbi:hypothetical protein [Streptomyces chilikensis]|uniref:Uncharacterized protein n=1 Tax=Streptomyces chilikensis TaxID=1194079 RepID=A0ABV3EJB6_9ACTN
MHPNDVIRAHLTPAEVKALEETARETGKQVAHDPRQHLHGELLVGADGLNARGTWDAGGLNPIQRQRLSPPCRQEREAMIVHLNGITRVAYAHERRQIEHARELEEASRLF